MSLRARLLVAITLALLLSLAAGAVLALRDAARMVSGEVVAALETASQGLKTDALPGSEAALRSLVTSFDGSRHVQVTLTDVVRGDLARSQPQIPQHPAPAWFAAMVTPPLAALTLPVANTAETLRVTPVPGSEAAERWSDARDRVLLLGLLSLLTGGLCFLTAAQGMRPLSALTNGFVRLGHGERCFRIPEAGPPEIEALTLGFNRMAAALAEAEALNTRLNSQLLRLAEEERSEIARDLHDEFGPLLFAITTFTATAASLIENGTVSELPGQLRAIDGAVAALQLAVRDMLGRLRETQAEPIDLPEALGKLIRFWQTIRPETNFSLSLSAEPGIPPEPAGEMLYRVAQEAVSNAVRHGTPQEVTVALNAMDHMVTLSITDDGDGAPAPGGYGLLGMQERVASVGGMLTLHQGAGWTVTARVPAR